MIIDSQVHGYAAHSDTHPWVDPTMRKFPPEVTGEDLVAAMDSAGIDGSILVAAWSVYGTDTGYVESVFHAYPERFRLVSAIDPTADDVEAQIERWSTTPGAVAGRLLFLPGDGLDAEHPGVVTAVRRAGATGLPVNVHCWERLEVMPELARAFPDVSFVLDHLGITQPRKPPVPEDVLAEIDQVVALASHPNLTIKVCSVCTYSREPFPYKDLWEPVGRVIDAFGVDRCMWGTDWQRTGRLVSVQEATDAFRDHWPLSAGDKATLMGGTAERVYDWPGTGLGS
jgi:L-fuconolactonase